MDKFILIYVRYLSTPFAVLSFGGIGLAMLTAFFTISWLEPAFFVLLWSGAIGILGTWSCIFAAHFVRCKHCGKHALVFPTTGFDIGHTVAIFQTQACHHCGAMSFT